MRSIVVILILVCSVAVRAAEVIPPAPAQYFNDYARVVSSGVAAQLNQTLEQFERQTSEQIVVAIFPKMQSDSAIEEYTVRVARAWRVGREKLNNGAVLFVFIQDRKLFLQVGYGLEGVIPDALGKRIIEEQITPHFKSGDYDAGLVAGVNALLAAARGEYKGTGRTVAEGRTQPARPLLSLGIVVVFVVLVILTRGSRSRYRRGWTIGGGGLTGWGGGWGGGGGTWSSGGSSGGGFSGGGGSFGGGGAGGSW